MIECVVWRRRPRGSPDDERANDAATLLGLWMVNWAQAIEAKEEGRA